MSKVSGTPFGVTKKGEEVWELTLDNGTVSCKIITFGAAVRTLTVPGRGGAVDVVLGYDTLAEYEENGGFFGAVVGRYANRIAGGRFALNGREYTLARNDGPNHLHGGPEGFDKKVWQVRAQTRSSVSLSLFSPDGEEGYPGNLEVTVTYTLRGQGLEIAYRARSSRTTLCNLTNHAYFNLNGSGDILGHRLWLASGQFTPVGPDSIPLAMARSAAGTPFDFTSEKPVGRDIGADDEQLRNVGGYDHNYVLDPAQGLRRCARLTGEQSGIAMEVWTEKPGVQLYSGNFLETADAKGGGVYRPRQGLCLETQFFPDSPNHPAWGDILLRPGRRYDYITEYRFDVE